MSRCLSGFSFRMCRTHLLVELAGGQVEGLLRSVVPAAVQPLPGTGVSEGLVEGRGGGGEGRGGEGRGGGGEGRGGEGRGGEAHKSVRGILPQLLDQNHVRLLASDSGEETTAELTGSPGPAGERGGGGGRLTWW